MTILSTVAELRAWRRAAESVYFVPTMGALHEGHAELVRVARRRAGGEGKVLVSIFVNPLQFGPNEDFSRYPRTFEADRALCEEAGADAIFAPSVDEVYFPDRSLQVLETQLSKGLCGASRPGHFDGVCTVVAKLLNLAQADEAIFGKKDYQQLAIIRRMVRDLDFPVRIVGVDTVREEDGLAMSSRNRYLTSDERAQAPALRAALLAARSAYAEGETYAANLVAGIREQIMQKAPLGRVDYVELVHRETLQTQPRADAMSLLALACWFGKARLIDNLELSPPTEELLTL